MRRTLFGTVLYSALYTLTGPAVLRVKMSLEVYLRAWIVTPFRGIFSIINTAISREVVGKNVQATIPKGNMGYDRYTVPGTAAVEPTFVTFL